MSVRFLTAAEVAARWACDPSYVRKQARAGLLVGMRLGTDWRFSVAAVEAYERAHTGEPETVAPAPKEVTFTTSADGIALPADYAPVFPDLWPGHEPQDMKKRPSAVTKGR